MFAIACLVLGLLAANDADLRFEVRDGTLYVRRGTVRASLELEDAHPEMHPDLALSVSVSTDGAAWTLKVDTNCQGKKTLRFPTEVLQARLESAAARRLARRKQWDVAGAGFARAIALDPSAAKAATDLAVVQVRGGHTREAIATLVTAAAHDRIWIVWRAAIDRDLAAVASAPELRRLVAGTPGRATLAALRRAHVAFAPEGGLVVWDRTVGNAMTDGRDPMELRIAELATGRLVARLPYRARDAKAVDRALADLGFEIEPLRARALTTPEGPKQPDLIGTVEGLRVAVKDGEVRVSSEGRVVGQAHLGSPVTGGWAARWRAGVVVGAAVNVGDGCGAWIYDDTVWIPLTAPH